MGMYDHVVYDENLWQTKSIEGDHNFRLFYVWDNTIFYVGTPSHEFISKGTYETRPSFKRDNLGFKITGRVFLGRMEGMFEETKFFDHLFIVKDNVILWSGEPGDYRGQFNEKSEEPSVSADGKAAEG